MKAVNIIGTLAGIFGTVLTLTNTHLGYAEGNAESSLHSIFPRHDNVGNVFGLLCVLFILLTVICAANLYKRSRRTPGNRGEE